MTARALLPFFLLTFGIAWGVLALFMAMPDRLTALFGPVLISVIVTPLFNASRGSILLPLLCHFQLNGPAWPDAQPFDNGLFAATAVLVVWLNRRTMFSRQGAATEVIPSTPGR